MCLAPYVDCAIFSRTRIGCLHLYFGWSRWDLEGLGRPKGGPQDHITWSEAWCFAPAFTASDLCGLSASTLSLLVRLYKYFASSWPFFARYFWLSQLLLSLRLPDLGGFRPHPHSRGQVSSRSDCHPCVLTWCEYRVSPFPH